MAEYIYVYQTKNLVNGKTYIGVHKTDDMDDGYIGGGISYSTDAQRLKERDSTSVFPRAVVKYGYDNFKCQPLCFFDDYEDALEEEKYLVDEEWVKRDDNYNVALGGNVLSDSWRREVAEAAEDRFYKGIKPYLEEYLETKMSFNSFCSDKEFAQSSFRKYLKRYCSENGLDYDWISTRNRLANKGTDLKNIEGIKMLIKYTDFNMKEISEITGHDHSGVCKIKNGKKFKQIEIN